MKQFLLIALAFLMAGCAETSSPTSTISPTEGHVTHVVIVWLKDRNDTAAMQRVIDTAYSFRTMPGILNISCGKMVPAKRSAVDSSYDIGLVMQFDSLEHERAYEASPIHKKAVDEVLHPAAKKMLVYDFRE